MYLGDNSSPNAVIGVDLARKLGVKVGSKVVLMTQVIGASHAADKSDTGGEMKSTLLRVSGIFRTGLQPVDSGVIHLSLPVARTLLGVNDQEVTQIALLLAQERDSLKVANGLRTLLLGKPVEILTWRESMPMLAQMLRLDRSFNYVMNVVVLTMVGLGILNTILMRVVERRYEFGVCAALGLRPLQLGIIITGDTGLTSISLAIGLMLGLGINHFFATDGLDFRWIFGHHLPPALVFDPILYSRLSASRIASSVSVVFVMAILISLYPAIKAARTELPQSLEAVTKMSFRTTTESAQMTAAMSSNGVAAPLAETSRMLRKPIARVQLKSRHCVGFRCESFPANLLPRRDLQVRARPPCSTS